MADSYPVSLFTGLPGAGKTATLVKRILDLHKDEPGRPVFHFGINGLKEGLAIPLTEDMLHKWWELPPGSIICVDECQEDGTNPDQPVSLMPKDRGSPPPWVQRITKVRHYGMSFLLTTQHPANMSAYVRRLVNLHVHSVIRSKGVRQTFTWMRCVDDPDNRREKKMAEMSFASLPKEVFDLYKSSSLHTMKVGVPRLFYIAGALMVALAFLAWYIPHRVRNDTHPVTSLVGSTPSAQAAADKSDLLRIADYGKWMKPRVSGVPWSAPMFDHLEVKAQPRLYCVAVDDGRCSCNTEQGTRYEVPVKQCRQIVSDGMYNPFQAPLGHDGDTSGGDDTKQVSQTQPPGRRGAASPLAGQGAYVDSDASVGSSSQWAASPMRASYVAPELEQRPEYQPHTLN